MENGLGISMAPTTMRMVQVEGENADGVTVSEENVERTGADGPATRSGSGDRGDAGHSARGGRKRLPAASTGVTITDPAEAAALGDRRSKRSGALIAPAWEAGRLS